MSIVEDRGKNVVDGTYVNAPDYHKLEPSKFIGLREYNNGVLIHNWYEDRNPAEKKEFPKNSTYRYDFKAFPDAKPDVFLRRKMIGASEGIGSKHLIGMHNFDSSKNMISLYDETINKRVRPGPEFPAGQKFPEKREWKMINESWVPEKVDHPLQGEPTKWGLVDKKRNEKFREDDKYKNQLPHVSEYSERFQKHPSQSYLQRTTNGIPKEISASFNDINLKLNNTPKARATNGSLREPQARDVMDTVYSNMLVKSNKAPRTLYYLGKVPTNGALDVYSMKNFETLTPVHQPSDTSAINPANKVTDLSTLYN